MTNACVVLLDMLGTALTLPAISSPVSIILAMTQFHWELFAKGMGSYKHNMPNTPLGTCAMLNAAAVTFIQTQEEEKEKEKEVVAMSSS